MNSVPTVAPIPDVENISTKEDANNGHEISKMSTDGIPHLGNGWRKHSVEEGNNNENKN